MPSSNSCAGNSSAMAKLTPRRLRATTATVLAFVPFSAPALAAALNTPPLTGPLVANPDPISLDAGPLGTVYVTGAATGILLWQDDRVPGNEPGYADLSNGQIFVQKTDGWLQFFADIGAYSQP